jgi:DNA-binding response OmpR family regulator
VASDAASGAPHVLLIDDDVEALRIFEQILRDSGFDVRTADTAEQGLAQLEAELPLAIILDLRLPALDGVECLRRIRAMPGLAGVPVTIITGDYLVDDSIITQIEAMDGRLCLKPIWEEDLLRMVRNHAQ